MDATLITQIHGIQTSPFRDAVEVVTAVFLCHICGRRFSHRQLADGPGKYLFTSHHCLGLVRITVCDADFGEVERGFVNCPRCGWETLANMDGEPTLCNLCTMVETSIFADSRDALRQSLAARSHRDDANFYERRHGVWYAIPTLGGPEAVVLSLPSSAVALKDWNARKHHILPRLSSQVMTGPGTGD